MSDNKAFLPYGFTLVEMLVVVPIIMLVIAGISSVLVNLVEQNAVSSAKIQMTYATHASLKAIQDEVAFASAFLTTTEAAYSDPYSPDGAGGQWSYKGSSESSRVLILRGYATTQSFSSPSRDLVYKNTLGCASNVLTANPIAEYNAIFFVQNGHLYRRTVTDSTVATCTNAFQRQSCPPDIDTPHTLCQTDDELLAKNIAIFDVQYFDSPTSVTPMDVYSAADTTALDGIVSIEVTIGTRVEKATKVISQADTLRIMRLN